MQSVGGYWNPGSVSALAALGGSLVGALVSAVSTWMTQQHQDRRDFLAKKISQREQLYSDFISESAKVMVDAAGHTFQDPGKLIPTYALLSRIRLSSPSKVVESAERIITRILDTYSQPNLTPAEIGSKVGNGDDPLRDFSQICRCDLESLWRSL